MTNPAPPADLTQPSPTAPQPHPAPPPLSGAERARRQSQLHDEGLEETFPASDPVSIVRVD
jgi:hypothetical protein